MFQVYVLWFCLVYQPRLDKDHLWQQKRRLPRSGASQTTALRKTKSGKLAQRELLLIFLGSKGKVHLLLLVKLLLTDVTVLPKQTTPLSS